MTNEEILKKVADLVAEGESDDAVDAVKEAFAQGLDAITILNQGASKGMDVVSEQYSAGEAYLPELVLAGDAMTAVIEVIFANMSAEDVEKSKQGVVVMGQAKGDVHDIGKNVVSALLAVNGFEVHDIGIDAPVKAFYEKAAEVNADIVGISTLLTTSLPYLNDTLQYLADTGNRYTIRADDVPQGDRVDWDVIWDSRVNDDFEDVIELESGGHRLKESARILGVEKI